MDVVCAPSSADEALFTTITSMLLCCNEEEVETTPSPIIHTPQLLPAFFSASARAPLPLQARQLERLSLWLRLNPSNCAALTATATLWQPHAAAMLAAALSDAMTSGAAGDAVNTAGAPLKGCSLCLTYMIELLCTYAIVSLELEMQAFPKESWHLDCFGAAGEGHHRPPQGCEH